MSVDLGIKFQILSDGTLKPLDDELKKAEAHGFAKAIDLLRSEEAKLLGKEQADQNFKHIWGPTLMSGDKWSNWLESKNPYVGEKEGNV